MTGVLSRYGLNQVMDIGAERLGRYINSHLPKHVLETAYIEGTSYPHPTPHIWLVKVRLVCDYCGRQIYHKQEGDLCPCQQYKSTAASSMGDKGKTPFEKENAAVLDGWRISQDGRTYFRNCPGTVIWWTVPLENYMHPIFLKGIGRASRWEREGKNKKDFTGAEMYRIYFTREGADERRPPFLEKVHA